MCPFSQEVSMSPKRRREEAKAIKASMLEIRNKTGRFHCSGVCLATALS